MRQLVALLFALTAISAHAQIGPPGDVVTIGIPVTVQTGSVTLQDGSDTITAGGGVSSPIPGFILLDIDSAIDLVRYNSIDLTGGTAVVACFALPCSGIPEQENGVDTDEGWSFVDGIFIPRFDFGILKPISAGAVGGGVTLGTAGASSTGSGGNRAWVDLGPQLAYGVGVGSMTAIATGSYVWGFEGGSQKMSGRGVRLKALAVFPVGGLDLMGTFSFDRRTDDGSNDTPTDDFEGSFVTFSVGLGF